MTDETSPSKAAVRHLRLSRAALAAAPPVERDLFLAAAHVTNELNVLHKLAVWSGDFSGSEPIQRAQICQTLMFFRLLAGKLNEANELLRVSYFGTKLSKTYDSLLPPEAVTALSTVKRYFAGGNIINSTRKEFAFHYSATNTGAGLVALPEEEQLDYYVGPTISNTFYYFSEVSVATAMLGQLDREHFERFAGEIITIAGQFLRLLDGFLGVFTSRHGAQLLDSDPGLLDLGDLPRFDGIRIPWFTVGAGVA